jgi:hypothetical protein
MAKTKKQTKLLKTLPIDNSKREKFIYEEGQALINHFARRKVDLGMTASIIMLELCKHINEQEFRYNVVVGD